ncbi:HAD-IIB family hydrolase [Demequina zhanjiangensis]|uniref:HAD-IIB family hydrolase n=1 Tax=Demequina zhanjiangensis TaxID=3051659 RepID=A0ABT8FZV0_9MICO|nr:HAD-IIB family hydrolase [Demequina sp. SYSU T00b26]MDN4472420.1 HAD-IIB family hydrolase [Demequina sp. SYSU T00b26]
MTDTSAASDRKAIFLDIDGTYAHRGTVPEAHKEAVRAARAAGNLVFLCTGRPQSLIFEQMTEAGFDGIVAAAGGHVRIGEETLLDLRFPEDLAARTIAALDAHDAVYWLETPEATYARQPTLDRVDDHLPAHMKQHDTNGRARAQVLEHLTILSDLSDVRVGKITIMHADVPLTEIAAEVGPDLASISSSIPGMGDRAGELYMADVHKATGIAAVIAHLGMTREDVLAFGDGPNDIEMLDFAGIGVAIEGSAPELLAVADRTCAGPEEAGLATAFAELGLLTR